ncbi:MAG: ATP-binding protein [Clostridia bacterium]|nr:ATP-binding protein [Clostridia bacterium]
MYGYDNYQKVKEEINERRQRAIKLADERNAHVRDISKDIRIIDAELVKTGLLLFKTACEGGNIDEIRERNLKLNEDRRAVLKTLGYPEDYTEVKYTCPICSDTGFTDINMCSCFREALLKENIKSSGIGELIEKQSFDNFSLAHFTSDPDLHERMEKNLNVAKDFANNFGKASKNLLLMGPTGTGKTHISTAIAKTVIEKGYDVIYDSTQNIVSAFEADKFKSGYGYSESKSNKYLECDLLILDDLGTEFSSQFTVTCLYNLLNTRLNKGLFTVISTNLSPAELSDKYEDRIYSRIIGSDSRILLFGGKDRRINGK